MSPATATVTAATVLDLDRPAGTAGGLVALLLDPVDGWKAQAACLSVIEDTGTDLFYGGDGEAHAQTRDRERRAKRLCGGCPVRPECLRYALATREGHGIWGGLTGQERRELLAEQGVRLPKHPSREAVGGGW